MREDKKQSKNWTRRCKGNIWSQSRRCRSLPPRPVAQIVAATLAHYHYSLLATVPTQSNYFLYLDHWCTCISISLNKYFRTSRQFQNVRSEKQSFVWRVCIVSRRGKARARGGGRGRSDQTTYLYNGINYSSSGKLRPPAPPKLYSNINFVEEKPFWEHLIKIRQNHNWKFSSRREEAARGGSSLHYLLSRGINSRAGSGLSYRA